MSEGGRGPWRGDMAQGGLVTIGPRTTIHTLLSAYPFLRGHLTAWDEVFAPLEQARGKNWARVTSVSDAALAMDVPWRRLVSDLRRRIEDELGVAPPAAGPDAAPHDDDKRLLELRAIAGELEDGGSLLELADRMRGLTEGLSAADAAALDRAMAIDAARSRARTDADVARAAEEGAPPPPPPPGHPVDNQRRAGEQLRRLAADLAAELERMGGAPGRRRWRACKPMVMRLVDRTSDVESMFRRHRQAWFPALAVHGVEGLGSLLADREAEALELLRRLRLAVEHDDGQFVAEGGARLLEVIDDVLNTVDQVVVPLALRHLSEADWRAVRELEDSVGFALIPLPPPWPPSGS